MNYSQDTLSYPTDIVYDEQNQEYYVSNWANDYPGYILKLNNNGEIIGNFYSSLDLPSGLCLVGDTLYVLNNKDLYGGNLPSYLLGIDINTGQLVVDVELGSGGIYVDLLTTDNKGHLYITDSENHKIYKYNIELQTFIDFVIDIDRPIGICYNYIDDLVMFTISSSSISYIASIPVEGGDYQIEASHDGWLEGLIMASDGDYFASSWSSNGPTWGNEPVFKLPHDFGWENEVSGFNNRPFGMCVGYSDQLAVCNWGSHEILFNDTVTGIDWATPSSGLEVFPNPTSGTIQIDFSRNNVREVDLSVFDISGKEVYKMKIKKDGLLGDEYLDFGFLEPGTYFLTGQFNNGQVHEKIIVY